jgi:predicted amidohydrolase
MKAGYIQTSPVFGDKQGNFQQVSSLIHNISVDLLVLPELFATGYAFVSKDEVEALAEEGGRETAGFLKQLSHQTGAVIVAGFIEKDKRNFYNSAMMVRDDHVIGIYRKIHLFNEEKRWFTPGDKPFEVYSINNARIGMMICFDWIFPESCRTLALLGAQVIAHPANLVLPWCQAAMQTRCLENRVFAITANRIGRERRGSNDFNFTGGSQVTAVNGAVLSSAPTDKAFVDVVELDASQADNKMINDYNDLLIDRRTEFYE